LISSPEYAHGVPGALKNALDWLVGSGERIEKPVAVINASARATHAWESLVETLTVMSASVVRDASITLPLGGRAADADTIAGRNYSRSQSARRSNVWRRHWSDAGDIRALSRSQPQARNLAHRAASKGHMRTKVGAPS
jgi:NADPH-dependent FMN reductase